MKNNWSTFFFRAVFSYTLSVVLLSITLLFIKIDSIQCTFLLQLLFFVFSIEGVDYLISGVEFRYRIVYLSMEFILMYLCFLMFSYFGKWFVFVKSNVILFSCEFFIIFLFLHLYEYFRSQMEANDINQNLERRKK